MDRIGERDGVGIGRMLLDRQVQLIRLARSNAIHQSILEVWIVGEVIDVRANPQFVEASRGEVILEERIAVAPAAGVHHQRMIRIAIPVALQYRPTRADQLQRRADEVAVIVVDRDVKYLEQQHA